MCSESTAVPATTIPSCCRRLIDAATAVPPRADEIRSWLPPVMKNPVAYSRRSCASGPASIASSRIRMRSTSTRSACIP
jgi:hypothetical protein